MQHFARLCFISDEVSGYMSAFSTVSLTMLTSDMLLVRCYVVGVVLAGTPGMVCRTRLIWLGSVGNLLALSP